METPSDGSDSEEVDYEESHASVPDHIQTKTLENNAFFETLAEGMYNSCWRANDALTNQCNLNVEGQHAQMDVLAMCEHPKIPGLVLVSLVGRCTM